MIYQLLTFDVFRLISMLDIELVSERRYSSLLLLKVHVYLSQSCNTGSSPIALIKIC